MSIPGRPVVILPGKRPPPERLDPPDVAEIVRVLNGEPPKVCPACGRSWRPDAPCVCLELEPVVSWWARAWRALSALWAEAEPRVIYEDEVPRPQPMPRPRGRDYTALASLATEARAAARKVKDP
jgi:hypothetical protein